MSGGWQSQSDREREEELPGLQLQWPKTVELPPIHIIQTTIRDIFKEKLKDYIWEEDWGAFGSEQEQQQEEEQLNSTLLLTGIFRGKPVKNNQTKY